MKAGVPLKMLRCTITDVEDCGTRQKPKILVVYRIRLRGSAKDKAENIVAILKDVFSDSDNRKFFLDAFWKAAGKDGKAIQEKLIREKSIRKMARRESRKIERQASRRNRESK